MPIIFWTSWKIIVNKYELAGQFNVSTIDLSDIPAIITGNDTTYRVDVFHSFITAMFKLVLPPSSISLSSAGWLVILLTALVTLIYFLDSATKRTCRLALFIVVIGILGYYSSLLMLYLFSFSEYEAGHLASFARYSGTFITSTMILVVALSIRGLTNHLHDASSCAVRGFPGSTSLLLACIFIFLVALIPQAQYEKANGAIVTEKPWWQQVADYINEATNNDGEGIYYVDQAGDGGTIFQLSYALMPRPTNRNNYFRFGSTENGVYGTDVSGQEIAAYLDGKYTSFISNGCKYLYLISVDDEFVKRFGTLFEGEPEDNCLYIIHRDSEQISFTLFCHVPIELSRPMF